MRTGLEAGKSAVLVLVVLWFAAFSFSCRLVSMRANLSGRGSDYSIADSFLSAGRLALSSYFYGKADEYFHRGAAALRKKAFSDGVFQSWLAVNDPAGHVHLEGHAVAEMMPWLWLAIRANPENVENYLIPAFWLVHDCKRADIAHRLLAEARWNNPFDYRVAMEDGCIYLREGLIAEAATSLDTALAFWPGKQPPESDDSRQDKARILLYRALIYEMNKDNNKAIATLEEILKIFPDRIALRDRIGELRTGDKPSLLAAYIKDDMLRRDAERNSCKNLEKKTDIDTNRDEPDSAGRN